jgi:hypothetical protein
MLRGEWAVKVTAPADSTARAEMVRRLAARHSLSRRLLLLLLLLLLVVVLQMLQARSVPSVAGA